jgi:uncharacterized membrane protein YfcA
MTLQRETPLDLAFATLFAIVVLANTAEAVTGFGGTIIVVTLAAHLYGIGFLVPTILPINLAISVYLIARYHARVDRKELLRRILPLTGLGLPIGYALFRVLGTEWLRRGYGAFVFAVALVQLALTLRAKDGPRGPRPGPATAAAFLVSGGIIHGLYASGGPLVVLYASRAIRDKGAFRSTLSALWLVVNTVLVAVHVAGGSINAATAKASVYLLPSLVLGIALGEFLHDRIDERRFRLVVFALLVVAGGSLALRA